MEIKVFALGGLAENGKNLYCIEYNNEVIIIDAGLTNSDNKAIGVDSVIPDLDHLRKKNIKAVLISHGHIDQMGAINHILKIKPKVKIYASDYTCEFLKLYGVHQSSLDVIKYDQVLKLGEFEIEAFKLSHAIFGNYGFLVNTKSGAIVYTTDYNFNQTVAKVERTDIEKIIKLKNKYQIKILLTEVLDIDKEGVASSGQEEIKKFKNLIENATGRVIISLYSSNVTGVNNVIAAAELYDKKISIIGRDLLNYVNISRSLNYISHSQNRFKKLSDLKIIPQDKQIIIISGLYEEPFNELAKMSKKNHNFIEINEKDTVIIASKPYDKIESYAQSVRDDLARTYARIVFQKLNISSHAQKEDVKMMINLFEPKFIMPIKGEYRKQVELMKEAEKLSYPPSRIIIANNGEVISLNNENYSSIEQIPINDISMKSVRGKREGSTLNNIVIRDREKLSDSGYVVIIIKIDQKTKKILGDPTIETGGIIKFDNDVELMGGMKKIISQILREEETDLKKKQTSIRIKITRYLENNINKSPLILSILLEVSSE